jgi:preprotein translocase subunit Sss1
MDKPVELEQLEMINSKLDTIINIMKKPGNKFIGILEVVAAGISVLGILSIMDIIRNWIGG